MGSGVSPAKHPRSVPSVRAPCPAGARGTAGSMTVTAAKGLVCNCSSLLRAATGRLIGRPSARAWKQPCEPSRRRMPGV